VREQAQRGLLGLLAVGDEAGDQGAHEGGGAARAGGRDLAEGLHLIGDGLDDRPVAQEARVRAGDEP